MRIKYKLTKIDFPSLQRILFHFGSHLRKHRLKLATSSLALLGVTATTILRPWPLKVVFDYILMPENASETSLLAPLSQLDPMTLLALAAGSVVTLAVIKGLLTYSHAVLSKKVGHRLVADLRMQLFSHVQRLPQSYHDYKETGELMTRMTGDISLLQNLLVSTVITSASQILLVAGMMGIMFWMDWHLALVVLGVIPFFVLAAFRFSVRIKSSAKKQREQYGKIVASVQETFSGITQVKSFAQENKRERLIGKSMDRDVQANVKTTKLAANYSRTVEFIGAVATCLVLWLGVRQVLADHMTPGDLLIFLSYLRGIYRPLKNIERLSTQVAKATVRGEKIMELLEMKPEVTASEEIGKSAANIKGDFKFENITFSYIKEQPILKDFSCRIPPGKTTVIIGPTGAGKSTVAKLILRLYEAEKGMITLDDFDLREYKIRSLRKRITPLTQETFLFRMSIGENIGFAKRRAKPEEIIDAAKLVGAHEFIEKMPDGYNTLVGESGLTLSGGQKQRISFARAALRQSPVMIFDEPTTGLDAKAEKQAKEVLASLRPGRTMIIITHRMHFLDLADWAIFVRDGQMVEEGNPNELMLHNGEFHKFVSAGKGIIGHAVSASQISDVHERDFKVE